MPTWFALTVTDAAGERRELVEVFTALEDAEGARDEVLEDDPNLSKIVRVDAVEVADL